MLFLNKFFNLQEQKGGTFTMIFQNLSGQLNLTVLEFETKTHYSSIFLNNYFFENWMIPARAHRFLSN
jgi:hypothetical protein